MVGKKEEIKRSFLKEELFLAENTLAIAFHPLEINFSRLWARNVEEICLTEIPARVSRIRHLMDPGREGCV